MRSRVAFGTSPMTMDLCIVSDLLQPLGLPGELASLIRSFAYCPSLPQDELSCVLTLDGKAQGPLTREAAGVVFSWIGRWLGTHAVEEPLLSSLHLAFWTQSTRGLRLRLELLALENTGHSERLAKADIWWCWKQRKWGIQRVGGIRSFLRSFTLDKNKKSTVCACSPHQPIATFLLTQLDLLARRLATSPACISLIALHLTSSISFEATFCIEQAASYYPNSKQQTTSFILAFYFDHLSAYHATSSPLRLRRALGAFRHSLLPVCCGRYFPKKKQLVVGYKNKS